MAKQLEPKILKHQQHLKLQKEAEEELWISGEELRTDGSSDEEHQKNYKAFKKIKRRKSGDKKESTLAASSLKMAEESTKEDSSVEKDVSELSDEDIEDIPVSWRPKRGSLKLPNLYEGVFNEKRTEILINENIYQGKFSVEKCLPMIKPQEIQRITNCNDKQYNDKLMAMMSSISQLEECFLENMNHLKEEKSARLKIEEEMCSEIYNDEEYHDKNASLFLQLCNFEGLENSEENDDKNQDEKNDNCPKRNSKNEDNAKNFIRRNIELAATAMSRLPLTDEEKQHLERLLSDIDLIDTKEEEGDGESSPPENTNNANEDEKMNPENAFHIPETDKQRLQEIDLELQNKFPKTQNLKSSSENEDNFWKNLVLDQTLKDIDEKLAVLKEQDIIEES